MEVHEFERDTFSSEPSLLRQKASKALFGVAFMCLVFAAIAALVLYFVPDKAIKAAGAENFMTILTLYGLINFIAMLAYFCGAPAVRVPNPSWESFLKGGLALHIVLMVGWLGMIVWADTQTGHFSVFPYLVNGGAIMSLARTRGALTLAAEEPVDRNEFSL